jgi:hypothetical protein
METPYDWITVGIFAGLIVLFMQRSMAEEQREGDSLLLYLAAGVGCAGANYFGNEEQHLVAILIIALTLGFIFHFLKPFEAWPKR